MFQTRNSRSANGTSKDRNIYQYVPFLMRVTLIFAPAIHNKIVACSPSIWLEWDMARSSVKLTIGTLLLLAIATDTFAAGEKHCRKEWPTDFRMQKYCIDQDNKGALDTYAWMFAYQAGRKEGKSYIFDQEKVRAGVAANKPWAVIAKKCFTEWNDQWRMIAYCLDQQTKAALSMGIPLD